MTTPKPLTPCARYFGSDLTLCATHHVPFASPSETRCGHIDALRVATPTPAEPGLRAAAFDIKAEHDRDGHREPCALCAALGEP